MKRLTTIIALSLATPGWAAVGPFQVRITYRGDYIVGADYEVDIHGAAGHPVMARTVHPLAPDWKPGEPYRLETKSQSISSDRCPAIITALERLSEIQLPKMNVLQRPNPDGSINIPPYALHIGRYTLEAPTQEAGSSVIVTGNVRDPVGVWLITTMNAVEPCWQDQQPTTPLSNSP